MSEPRKAISLMDKCTILRDRVAMLTIKCASAINGDMEWREVRHYYGQTRRILRTIERSLHNAAKKQQQRKGREAMEKNESDIK